MYHVVDIWRQTKKSIEYVKERSEQAVTSLYWTNVKIANNRSKFKEEESKKAAALYDDFLETLSVYEKLLELLNGMLPVLAHIIDCAEQEETDIDKERIRMIEDLTQKEKICIYMMRDCLTRQGELLKKFQELESSLNSRAKKERRVCSSLQAKRKVKWRG